MKSRSLHPLGVVLTASLLLASHLLAQTAPTPAAAVPEDRRDEIVTLSVFEVSAEGDDGYKAANAISGTRFNTSLLDLPRPIEVITSEFIEDIGAKEIGEALRY